MQATRTLRKPSTPGQRYRDGQRKKQTVYHGNPVREPQKLTAEQQALVVQWTGLVSWAMNRWFSKAPAWMHPEIRSAGFLALVEAAERYDAKKLSPRTGKPVKFKTCALAWLWGRMVSERSRLGDRRDLQMPAVVDTLSGVISPADVFAADPTPGAEQVVSDREDRAQIAAALAALPPKWRFIVERRFGLGKREPMSLAEIGEAMGVCKERVRQIDRQAIARLAAMLAGVRGC